MPLAGTSPAQDRAEPSKLTVPPLAAASLSQAASSSTPPSGSAKLAPVYGLPAELTMVMV